MDITTTYLGMELKTPLVVSASPFSKKIDNIKRLEDAGASAIVFNSLFEEQIRLEKEKKFLISIARNTSEKFIHQVKSSPTDYLEKIRKAKEVVNIPIIASLNGFSQGPWTEYAQLIEESGADALELCLYHIAADKYCSSQETEISYLQLIESIRNQISIPLAVKLSPFFSNIANMAQRIVKKGAEALVLFNRFYQPDIDLTKKKMVPNVLLSSPSDMRLPMRWIAILKDRIDCDFAASSGISSGNDVIKMTMVGADISMVCSALLKNGISHLSIMEQEVKNWMEKYEYPSLTSIKGCISSFNVTDPGAYERLWYIKAINDYKI
ncbi:dihydroorotate dehydrogenase-like protein [Xanthovirga aplysinae]|uniref:dihydroorotate dehydrogenase-like protein n=1 Tax=Xanthovirga aplysinae TaxID=2529853 RepID=UPI0012BD6C25|nr:dihydroorotate dehydrogenase-like protein [Xanthovirga aplysinae]MTI33454.1 dihydroorotate dehydrogenase-like protein [Xanthovirga aplysinae]